MSTRTNFDNNLTELKDLLLKMAEKSEYAIKEAMIALINQDMEKAKQVIDGDNEIDDLEYEINDKALLLIARQSPVATDLRKISVALKVSSEVERFADIAVNIAKSALHIGNQKHFKEIIDIPRMMGMALEMVSDSIQAYYSEDIELAKKSAEKDDEVDKMFGSLIQELLSYIPQNPNATNQIIQLSFVCRYIERIADHSTNIAENVIYLVTGDRVNLNA
ncbi:MULTISPECIES: phosphate signaling complex protein PhoU [Neobacillus]|jgi:phosphate transport system protein|uniref:phosphate signaling complex protein PhoU n=1 Tax=Neobacillus TaxID=2675232 RepID=UPI000BFA6AAD|nr:phosphate signaling complex protein PhoU [Neobacillus sp. OS1-33]NHC40091.1 phosphate signaling complex protein PhoU [Bacillus sp. MM2020_1]PEQ96633.1 phosphate transport system regulatory protein PhoU [Bacillus sp. AFS006103]WML25582.1 phosphate signaling complex protein PhoU [Neobacillus sp. OS1-33]